MQEIINSDATRIAPRQESRARCSQVARRWMIGLWVIMACQCAMAQALYRITPLGYLNGCSKFIEARGLNDRDQVTGNTCGTRGGNHAFLWANDGTPIEDLGPPGAISESEAYELSASGLVVGPASVGFNPFFIFVSSGGGAPMKRIYDGLGGNSLYPAAINNGGQVAGQAYTATGEGRAFLWKNDGSPMLDLGTFGGFSSDSSDINDSGQIAGISYYPGSFTPHAFIWRNDGTPIVDLGTLGGEYSYPYFINASGQITGISTLRGTAKQDGPQRVFFWANDGTAMQDLGTLGAAYTEPGVSALNNAGQVAGTDYTTGLTKAHAFVWLNDGTPMKDLGTLGGIQSFAYDMNSSGQVTGSSTLAHDAVSHAFLWRNDGARMKDLNNLVDPTDPLQPYVTLTSGDFINDHGDVLADGTDNRTGKQDLYLLKPTGGLTSVLTLTPRSFAFGNIPLHTVSAALSVTVTNTSPTAVAITGIALRGTNPKQFAFTEQCGKSLAGHASCTIQATFAPTTTGSKTAFLDVNGGGDGRAVKLTGTGT
jgi:probable HAF family extracellular repeat protein